MKTLKNTLAAIMILAMPFFFTACQQEEDVYPYEQATTTGDHERTDGPTDN
ncbi:hypothetical protein [Allomuricauda sp. NBRC 101325]|uniref:hypothetical protein n=1 Tax=Allomuricauda sp. NBRC 101325 TaxID=1113758 RepID=UPI00255210AE|nr:hypothetical protein [Muricauda sp. NBRC 101325]